MTLTDAVLPAVTEVGVFEAWRLAAAAGPTVIARPLGVVTVGDAADAVIVWATALVSSSTPPTDETPAANVIVVPLPKAIGAPLLSVTVGAAEFGETIPPANVSAWSPV